MVQWYAEMGTVDVGEYSNTHLLLSRFELDSVGVFNNDNGIDSEKYKIVCGCVPTLNNNIIVGW